MNGLNNFFSEHSKALDEGIAGFLKYQIYEFDSMQELQELMRKYQKAFVKADAKLSSKKEELFKQKKLEKWKMEPETSKSINVENVFLNKNAAFSKMLPKETEELQDLFISYGYYTNRLMDEVSRIHKQKGENFVKHFIKFAQNAQTFAPHVIILCD